jgi:general secretion pathway protein D
MPFEETPVLPEWNDAMTLPPTYEQYLKEQTKKERQDD